MASERDDDGGAGARCCMADRCTLRSPRSRRSAGKYACATVEARCRHEAGSGPRMAELSVAEGPNFETASKGENEKMYGPAGIAVWSGAGHR